MARPTKSSKTKPRRKSGGKAARRVSPQGDRPARQGTPTLDELVADLVFEGPGDLLTNPKYMEGYGRPNQPFKGTSS